MTKTQTRLEKTRIEFLETMKKNEHYNHADELKRAWEQAIEFFNGGLKVSLLKKGNDKLAQNVLTWSLPSIVTCKMACKGCYVAKDEGRKPTVRVAWARNYAITLIAIRLQGSYMNTFKSILNFEIKKHAMFYNMPIVRLHVSGDFYCNDYLKAMLDIVKANENVYFYAYTKQLSDNKRVLINKTIKNINILDSFVNIDGKKYLNYGNIDDIKQLQKQSWQAKQPCFICHYKRVSKERAEKLTCGMSCTLCMTRKDALILFKKH